MNTRQSTSVLSGALVIAALLASTAVLARPDGCGGGWGGPGGASWGDPWREPGRAGVEQRIERMTEHLDLNPAQRDEIRSILEERRAQTQQTRQETRARIQAVLTPVQLDQIAERRAARVEAHLERLAWRLNLNPGQVEQVRAILAAQVEDPGMGRIEVREQISGVLNDDQRALFERGRMRAGRGGPDAPCGLGRPWGEVAF